MPDTTTSISNTQISEKDDLEVDNMETERVAKLKKAKSKVKKNHHTKANIGVSQKEEGEEKRDVLTTMKWQE